MRVIFIKDLKGQGKKGEIKEVKTGYAQNYLIKNGYAVPETKENLQILNNNNKKKAKEDAENRKKAEDIKEKLSKEVLEFKVKTGEGDKVFGSISLKQIKDELIKKGYKIEKSMIKYENTIQSLGFHNVEIDLYQEINTTVKIHVIK